MAKLSAEDRDAVLDFWFGSPPPDAPEGIDHDPSKAKMWWMGGEEVDHEIEERFGSLVRQALTGELSAEPSASDELALILVLDQFTRNLGRGTPEAFAGDTQAQSLSLGMIESGRDRELSSVRRSFAAMPLMHAEDRALASRSRAYFRALDENSPEGAPNYASHANQHADIVERFGRYPHRNEILGRESSAEEVEFLADGGPNFGQKKR